VIIVEIDEFLIRCFFWAVGAIMFLVEYLLWKFIYRGLGLRWRKLVLAEKIILGTVVIAINRYVLAQFVGALALAFLFSFI